MRTKLFKNLTSVSFCIILNIIFLNSSVSAFDPQNNILFNSASTTLTSQKNNKQSINVRAKLQRKILASENFVRTVAVSFDGQTIISGNDEGKIQFWSLKTGKLIRTLPGHSKWVQSIAINPDGKTIASGSIDGSIKLWTLNGELKSTLKNSRAIYSVTWSSDGKMLASGHGGGTVKLWTPNGKLIRSINAHSGNVVSIAISPNRKILTSRSFSDIANSNEEIKIWDLNTGKLIRNEIAGSVGGVNSLTISPDGKFFAAYHMMRNITQENSYTSETVKIWNLQTGGLVDTLNTKIGRPHAIAFSPNGKTLVIGGLSHEFELWNMATRKKLATLPTSHQIYSLAFSRDGKTFVTTGERSIAIWSLAK